MEDKPFLFVIIYQYLIEHRNIEERGSGFFDFNHSEKSLEGVDWESLLKQCKNNVIKDTLNKGGNLKVMITAFNAIPVPRKRLK